MLTFLVERAVPARFDDPDVVALHARWAADAYRKVGAFWLGGVITDDGMFSAVAVEREADLHAYARSLGIPDGEMRLRIFSLEADDQAEVHPAGSNKAAKSASRNWAISAAVMAAAPGSSWAIPNAATKLSSTACLAAGAGLPK